MTPDQPSASRYPEYSVVFSSSIRNNTLPKEQDHGVFLVKNKEMLDLFWAFITERQNVWYKRYKACGSPPWTDDLVLRTNRFTNIYRELDPGTQYVIRNVLETKSSAIDRVFNTMIYRLIGRSTTHSAIGFQSVGDFDSKSLIRKLKRIRDVERKPVFTAAYMVSGYSQFGSNDKIVNVCRIFSDWSGCLNRHFEELENSDSPATAFRVLEGFPGLGKFLAFQVLVDLQYPLQTHGNRGLLPFDNDQWAMPGPGARKGIALLANHQKVNKLELMRWLRDNQFFEFNRLGLDFPYLTNEEKPIPVSLANIQNCLCEFHKYVKIRDGYGRARRKFEEEDYIRKYSTPPKSKQGVLAV